MQIREYDYILDIRKSNNIERIELVQNDTQTNIFNITLKDGEDIYNLEDTIVNIVFKKPDKTTVTQGTEDLELPLTIEDNAIRCIVKTNTIAAHGTVDAEVKVSDTDGRTLTSQTFKFNVRRSKLTDKAVESTNELPLLQRLINEVAGLSDLLTQNEIDRNEELQIKLIEFETALNNFINAQGNIIDSKISEVNNIMLDVNILIGEVNGKLTDVDNKLDDVDNIVDNLIDTIDNKIIEVNGIIGAIEIAEGKRILAEQNRVIAEENRVIEFGTFEGRIEGIEDDLATHKEDYAKLNGEERLTTLEESKIKKYGVKFLGSNPAGERLYDAVGMVANVAVDDEVVINDFDNVSFYDRPICNVYFDTNGNPQVMAYRGEPVFSFEGGIFPPYSEKSDVYYECSPCGWNGSFDTPVVTGTPMEGFELFDCFPDWNTKIYLPTFFMGIEDGRPTSRSGVKPGYYSINTAFSTAQAWNINAHGETINAHMYEYILQCIEFATRDLQTVMYGVGTLTYNSATDLALISETGVNRIILARADNYVIGQTIVIGTTRNGTDITGERVVTSIEPYDENGQALYFDGEPTNIGIGNFVSSRAYKNGATDIVVASSGSPVDNTSGKYPCIWRGKVDPWGNGYSGISNLLTKRYGVGTPEDPYTYKMCYLKDPKKYANGVITNDYIELSYNLADRDGYAKELGQDARYPLIGSTKEIGAASTTYYADYYYYPRYDICAVFVGGFFDNGRGTGPLYFYCISTPASVNFIRLARLFVTPF